MGFVFEMTLNRCDLQLNLCRKINAMIKKITFLIMLQLALLPIYAQKYIAAVKKDSLWGYIDETGKTVIPFEYQTAHNFSCGRARVKKHNIWSYIDINNKSISAGKNYICKTDFAFNRAVVLDNESGRKVVVNLNGDIIHKDLEIDDMQAFFSGMARITVHGLYGFIDTNGVVKIKPKYTKAYRFNSSKNFPLALVERAGITLYVTNDGTEIIPPEGYIIRDYLTLKQRWFESKNRDSVLLMVRKVDRIGGNSTTSFGYMNRYGQLVFAPQFLKAENFREGIAAVSIDGKNWGYINTRGEIIVDFKLRQAKSFSGGIALCKTDKKTYIKMDGTELCNNPDVEPRYSFKNGYARIVKNDLWGFIDDNCNMIVPYKFNKVRDFSNGFARVQSGKLWGFVNGQGITVIEPIYIDSREFVPVNADAEEEDDEEEE